MAKWTKKTYRLDAMYGWEAKPGYNIFVADRGAVRFDFPQDWVMEPTEGGVTLRDREPPDDDCTLQVSIFHLPPNVDFSGLPLTQMLRDATPPQGELDIQRGPILAADRADMALVWREASWVEDGRDAGSRQALARGNGIQALLTIEFWADEAEQFLPAWEEILRSLRLGEYVRQRS